VQQSILKVLGCLFFRNSYRCLIKLYMHFFRERSRESRERSRGDRSRSPSESKHSKSRSRSPSPMNGDKSPEKQKDD
jgi:hypothetical protein